MEHDYYKILAVAPSADLKTIQAAYRAKVMQCHPDRGGSHAEMVLVNEAWHVLSDPELRQQYDAQRQGQGSAAGSSELEAGIRTARRHAEQYPRQWADMEKWLNSLLHDFAEARYGYTSIGHGGLPFPTVENSASGTVFLFVGGLAGALLTLAAVLTFDPTLERIRSPSPPWRAKILLLLAPTAIGALCGVRCHQTLRAIAMEWLALLKRARNSMAAPMPEKQRPPPFPSHPPPPTHRLLVCSACGQKMRVPALDSELTATCPRCGAQTTIPPP